MKTLKKDDGDDDDDDDDNDDDDDDDNDDDCKCDNHDANKTTIIGFRAVAVDPTEGYLYFTCVGITPQVARVGMSGGPIEVIVNKSVAWPNALAIDYVTKRVFWGDAHFDYIR